MEKTKTIVWHDATEEPKVEKRKRIKLLAYNNTDVFSFHYTSNVNWESMVDHNNIVLWAYTSEIIPDIPSLNNYKTIKTYEDACAALDERVDEDALTNAGVPKHIIALMKLELVCKALWGGEVKVYPDPNGNRTYYYPWFALYTKDKVERMDSEERGLLLSATALSGANAGWGSAGANLRSSNSDAYSSFRLCLDTYEKARYFGTQFLELWTEYLAYNFEIEKNV